jgi:Spy/CpxP family protein refolding chaperone
MNAAKKPLLIALLALVLGALFAGCMAPKTDSTIPWARPADWEGRIPGMTGD